MSEIMKIIDERETQKKAKTEKNKGDGSCNERVTAKWFCAFKLDFLQLICKASLIFKSNLELALSIVVKERELHESKPVVMKCTCLNIQDLLSFLISFILLSFSSILVLKWQQVSPI